MSDDARREAIREQLMGETDERIAAIRERAELATPGPWETHHSMDVTGYPCYFLHGFAGDQKRDEAAHDANAVFIAHAREDVPYLLGLLAAQADDLEALRDRARATEHHAHGCTLAETDDRTPERLSARWQELFWALPPGEMRSKLRALEIDMGRALREGAGICIACLMGNPCPFHKSVERGGDVDGGD